MSINTILNSFIPLIILNALGILLFWTGSSRWKERLSCKEKIQGTFLGFDVLGSGRYIHTAAKFEYIYNGQKIEKYALEQLSSRKKKKFEKGKNYILYVNPKNPRIIRCTKKTFHFEDFLQVIFGGFFIIGSFLTLLEELINFFL